MRMAIVEDEDGGCARVAISPSFCNQICCTLFAAVQMLAHFHFSTLFFFRDNFDGEVFLYNSAVKDSADL